MKPGILLAGLRLGLIVGCAVGLARADGLPTFAGPAMGTTYRVTLAGEIPGLATGAVHREVEAVLAEIDRAASTWRDDSDAGRFNRAASGEWVAVSADLAALVRIAREVHAASQGAFDITVGPLVKLWSRPRAAGAAGPTSESIAAACHPVGMPLVEWRDGDPKTGPALRKTRVGVAIDLAGIAPGYAVDRIGTRLVELGSRAHLVELGGEVRAWGRRPDESPWRVRLRGTTAAGGADRVIELADGAAIATSTVRPGRSPVDPRSGGLATTRVASITVRARTCAVADAWAVAALVLGLEPGADGTLEAPCDAAGKPNIVLILADDLGYGDVGCYGATEVKTPNIDRLAAEGRRFTDAHSASAVCTPSRYALLTGEYPFRKNLWGPVMNASPLVVDASRPTLASLLKRRGYATACFGKWHLGFGDAPRPDWNADLRPGPLECGFDHYFGIPVVNSHPPFVWVENHRVLGLDPADPLRYGGTEETRMFPEKMLSPPMSGARSAHALYDEEQHAATLAEKSLRWIRDHAGRPFFVYFATPHIHHPFTPGPRFKGSSPCGPYGDFIQEFDWMVGEVMRTLDELGLTDTTLVILTSDNGGMLNLGGQQAWKAGHRLNGNLLGFKFDAWEGGHRVPFIARWPGRVPAGSVSDQLVCQVDLLATFATLSGAALAAPDARDSLDILPALTGDSSRAVRDELVVSPSQKTHLALRAGRWMYIGGRGGGGFTGTRPGDRHLGGPAALEFAGAVNSDVEQGRFKADAPEAQLYDLAVDPWQTRNVIREHPETAARLQARLASLRDTPPVTKP